MGEGTWIRSTRRTRGFAALWGLLGLVFSAMGIGIWVALVLAPGDERPIELALGAVCGIVTLALASCMLVGARGCLRAGLMLTDEDVIVRNPLSRWAISRVQVESFAAGVQEQDFGNPTPGIVLDLRDGSHLRVWALAGKSRWEPVAGELNALLGARPSAGRPRSLR